MCGYHSAHGLRCRDEMGIDRSGTRARVGMTGGSVRHQFDDRDVERSRSGRENAVWSCSADGDLVVIAERRRHGRGERAGM